LTTEAATIYGKKNGQDNDQYKKTQINHVAAQRFWQQRRVFMQRL